MIKRTNNVVKVFFSILLVVSLTAAANDPFKKFKWTVGVGQDSSNPFGVTKSKLSIVSRILCKSSRVPPGEHFLKFFPSF